MKINPLSIVAALLCGVGFFLLAKSGAVTSGLDPKALVIGVVSAYIIYSGLNSAQLIKDVRKENLTTNNDLLTQKHPAIIKKLEPSTTSIASCSLQSAKYIAEINQKVSPARWFAAASVYFGLFGTIIGLSFAVVGLKNLGTDTQEIKNQILAVVSGFGGSFACAACGILVTVGLVKQLATLDELVETNANLIEIWLQKYINEKTVTSDNILEKLTEQFGIVLKTELAKALSPLEKSSDQLSIALQSFNAIAVSIVEESQNRTTAVENLKNLSAKLNSATDKLEATSGNLAKFAETLAPTAESMRSGSKLIIDSLTSIQPLFSAVADLTNICVQTEQAIRTLQQSTSGLVTIIKETTRESTSESVRTITSRQEELNGMLFPMLTAINDGMNSLNVVIERSDELIKQLPMSTAAERILDDLRNISDSAQQNVSRDATTIASTLDKVTVTEQNIQQTLIAIRATLEQLERSSAKNTYDFARLSSDVNALTAEIAKPFWKKLGDRRN